jgi:hypothetical protein
MSAKKRKSKILIGRMDVADFPELDLENIDVKIDTGAYTSSIHCKSIRLENNVLFCTFLGEDNSVVHSFSDFRTIRVKSSNGIAQNRYEIKTKIKLFNKTYKISLSLSNRKEMRFPVLLGRKFLNPKFVVDPSVKDLSKKNMIYEFNNSF